MSQQIFKLSSATRTFKGNPLSTDSDAEPDSVAPGSGIQRILSGQTVNARHMLQVVTEVYRKTGIFDMGPILPFLLRFKGKPFSFVRHPYMEPMVRFSGMSRRLIYKTGRQVGKSLSMSVRLLMMSLIHPYLNSLIVLPRFDQAKRLSSNYVAPLIRESPINQILIDPNRPQSVMQRTFKNGSILFFCHAFLSADSSRGISSDHCIGDEIQDIDTDHLPVLRECLAASKLKLETFTGTPKSYDNTIQTEWENSSQAEWITRCAACNHYNIPNREHGVVKMIGKNTIVCAKCGRPIDPSKGEWIHQRPELRHLYAGYHVPQVIVPEIYSNPEEWFLLRQKQTYAEHRFWNECLGESFDRGSRLFPLQLLREACTLDYEIKPEDKNSYIAAIQRATSGRYARIAIGVDWGGGGVDEVSLTAYAVVGILGTGQMEVIYMDCWPSLGQEEEEAKKLIHASRDFNADFFCHDFGGAGMLREVILIQAGLGPERIVPFVYESRRSESSPIVVLHEGGDNESRSYYRLDKYRSMTLLSMLVKAKGIAFPKYPPISKYLDHFGTLYYERMENARGADVILVRRSGKRPDDISHAVNYACCGLWHSTGHWPALASSLMVS